MSGIILMKKSGKEKKKKIGKGTEISNFGKLYFDWIL